MLGSCRGLFPSLPTGEGFGRTTYLEVTGINRLEAERVEDETDDVNDHDGSNVLTELRVDRKGNELEEVADLNEDDGDNELHEEEGEGEARSIQGLYNEEHRITSDLVWYTGMQGSWADPFVAREGRGRRRERKEARGVSTRSPFRRLALLPN
jgi:hypothetical protein